METTEAHLVPLVSWGGPLVLTPQCQASCLLGGHSEPYIGDPEALGDMCASYGVQ